MGEHRPLRTAGRARGVEHRGEIVRSAFDDIVERRRRVSENGEASGSVHIEPVHGNRQVSERGRPRHHDCRHRVVDEELDLGRCVGRVERQEHGTGAEAGQVQRHGVRRLVDLDDDTITDGDAAFAEGTGHRGRTFLDVAVGQRRTAGTRRNGESRRDSYARRNVTKRFAFIPDDPSTSDGAHQRVDERA